MVLPGSGVENIRVESNINFEHSAGGKFIIKWVIHPSMGNTKWQPHSLEPGSAPLLQNCLFTNFIQQISITGGATISWFCDGAL